MSAACFHLTLLMGRRIFWEVDATGIIEVPDAADAQHRLLSFDLHDHRQACPRPRSARSGRQAFMREWGEQVSLLERSASLQAQYGRDPRHAVPRPAGCGLVPGLQLIDLLAARRGLALAGTVCGLCLGVAGPPGRRLVILFGYDAQGELLRMQEAANPPSLDYLLDDFCRGTSMQVAAHQVTWFDQQDVLAVLPELLPYPEEDSLFGRPESLWWQQAARTLAALTIAAAAVAVLEGWQDWQLGQALAATRAAGETARAQLQARLAAMPLALAQAGSAAILPVFDDAEALWLPGTRVRVSSRPGMVDYTLIVDSSGVASSRQVATLADMPQQSVSLATALALRRDTPLPSGLMPLTPATSGDLHAFYLRFRRQTPLSALAAFADTGR